MKENLLPALPFFVIGLIWALLFFWRARKSSRPQEADPLEPAPRAEGQTFLPLGLALGMIAGAAVYLFLGDTFGLNTLTYCLAIGMLAGAVIGVGVKRK